MPAGELALAMARGQLEHEPVNLAPLDRLELRRNLAMEIRRFVPRVHELRERYQAFPGT
jgi:hypothetical protein